METAGWRRNPGAVRPLRCSRPKDYAAAGGPRDVLCRICWDAEEGGDAGSLVAPCACSGSMRYVHTQCLVQWQNQLRLQKGIAASRRCDVCKAAWSKAHMPALASGDCRQLLRDLLRSVPWPAVLECWKFCVLAVGAVRGMQAGVDGFRSGMVWAAAASRHNLEGLARWAPEMALAAGALPPLKVPMAICLSAFVGGLAAEVALLSVVCAYAGSIVGFISGVSSSLLCTLQLGSSLLRQGLSATSAVAAGLVRGATAVGNLAAPVLMGLMRTLALTRVLG